MQIVVGIISARYSGRGDTTLGPYARIVIRKADGTVSIHGDKGFKPMNYMASASEFQEVWRDDKRIWTFTTPKESLEITFHHIMEEINLELGTEDPGIVHRGGTEKQLQIWLSENLSILKPEYSFNAMEYQTGDGPVDILASRGNTLIAIEVKRNAPLTTVGQILRYAEALQETHPGNKIEAVVAALNFTPKTKELAAKRNVECLEIPKNWYEIEVSKTLCEAEDIGKTSTLEP